MRRELSENYEVVVIGAGVCGIYQIKKFLDLGINATVLEAESDLGGTWYMNRYPGARFDSESHTYGYSFSDELLKEWHRVLKPGAVLRLAVPDFEALTKLYLGGVATLENILGPLYGKWPMGSETIYHKTTYDERSLKDLLREIGFKKLARYDWKDTSHNEYDDHSQAYMCPNGDRKKGTLVSLNIQGTKV